jgi:hypothetical protein
VQRHGKHLQETLSRLAESAKVYPRAFQISDVKCELTYSDDTRAFGAVYQGELGGRAVCVKAIRTSEHNFDSSEERLTVSLISRNR